MRFTVTQVMDAIEQRLTTDITGAQAVVDVGAVVRQVELDRGRPVNLVRIGMVVDALARYLIDDGAMLYGVIERSLLSEQGFTSKERMVLGRWADDGLIEVTAGAADRVLEIADLTGLPLILLGARPEPAAQYDWLADPGGRVLRVVPGSGVASLVPLIGTDQAEPSPSAAAAVGRAEVPSPTGSADPEPADPERAESERAESEAAAPPTAATTTTTAAVPAASGSTSSAAVLASAAAPAPPSGLPPDPVADRVPAAVGTVTATVAPPAGATTDGQTTERTHVEESPATTEVPEPEEAAPAAAPEFAEATDDAGATDDAEATDDAATQPEPVAAQPPGTGFASAVPAVRTRISWRRFGTDPAHPESVAPAVRREWRCHSFDCPAFGEFRRRGQPAPKLVGDTVVCPRHDEPMTELGPRPPAYSVSIVVEELPRRRLVVRGGHPVAVGSTDDEPETVSVAPWLHPAAAAWVSPIHIRLEATEAGLSVTDVSDNGTLLWQRTSPDDPGISRPMFGQAQVLGQWDSVELYTGIELMRGDHRLGGVLHQREFRSVLLDAPTGAYHQISDGP